MKGFLNKKIKRIRRYNKLRKKIQIFSLFRFVVFRSSRHIYGQIICSKTAKVCVSACTLEKKIKNTLKYSGNKEAAVFIGVLIAKRALEKGIKKVSFDRSGFQYHGRIKALAESARDSGLIF
ncbi:50S ribosomal protein L18 [Buchnera aphidicola]|uniref:Large ribosomal subunit protein uL18 n=1 Tax=Buchnera aphidicola subsp. Tuberolachnus salignus TaxID=98804 RepID=A0A160SXP7_BUCTT|nr:50S ribosomal protein L18 [Buchnera aphidicola]CUR53305.1 50S ribosomal protein L18 [Buchnera aphidicola (Tuberolachnus salignus)]